MDTFQKLMLVAMCFCCALTANVTQSATVLWDQPLSTVDQIAYMDQERTNDTTFSIFLADDFTNTAVWSIGTIFVPGNGSTVYNATALKWAIYADGGGVPDGDPSGGGNAPFWSLSVAPTDSQVTITIGSGGSLTNTRIDLTTPVILPAGTWWLIFYPTMNSFYGRQPADTTNGAKGQSINPGGGYGLGTTWLNWDATQQDIAFTIEGSECMDEDNDTYGEGCTAGPDCNDNDSFYNTICPDCELKIIPGTLGWLIGDRERTRSLFVIGPPGSEFNYSTEIKWESDAIEIMGVNVFFKRFMFMRAKFNGEPLDKQEYRVLVGDCEGSIKWAK